MRQRVKRPISITFQAKETWALKPRMDDRLVAGEPQMQLAHDRRKQKSAQARRLAARKTPPSPIWEMPEFESLLKPPSITSEDIMNRTVDHLPSSAALALVGARGVIVYICAFGRARWVLGRANSAAYALASILAAPFAPGGLLRRFMRSAGSVQSRRSVLATGGAECKFLNLNQNLSNLY